MISVAGLSLGLLGKVTDDGTKDKTVVAQFQCLVAGHVWSELNDGATLCTRCGKRQGDEQIRPSGDG
jgi:hypothetical protein